MTPQASAVSDASVTRTDTSELTIWLRGIGVRQVRLACGLVMFTYIFSHFFNHALGNVSFAVMEWWRVNVHVWWWRIPSFAVVGLLQNARESHEADRDAGLSLYARFCGRYWG